MDEPIILDWGNAVHAVNEYLRNGLYAPAGHHFLDLHGRVRLIFRESAYDEIFGVCIRIDGNDPDQRRRASWEEEVDEFGHLAARLSYQAIEEKLQALYAEALGKEPGHKLERITPQ